MFLCDLHYVTYDVLFFYKSLLYHIAYGKYTSAFEMVNYKLIQIVWWSPIYQLFIINGIGYNITKNKDKLIFLMLPRIKTEWKVDAEIGKLQVGIIYRFFQGLGSGSVTFSSDPDPDPTCNNRYIKLFSY